MEDHRSPTLSAPARREPAHLVLLHGSMLLSGFGTVFLGPVLPVLAEAAHTTDSGSGLWFAAQFVGAFLGGVTTSSRLWHSLVRGSAAATFGFALLAFLVHAHAHALADAAALLPLGFGVGQMLTSVNLLTAEGLREGRGAALARVNFSWSLGAVMAPFLLGSLLTTVALTPLLAVAAILFAAAAISAGAVAWQRQPGTVRVDREGAARLHAGLGRKSFVYFAGLLLLYGGVETSLSGWITTFGTRYGGGALRTSTLGATALWCGITAGRALATPLLRRVREQVMLRTALLLSTLLAAALGFAHGATTIIALAGALGLTLASWFPLVLSSLMAESPLAAQVGTIIAVSGLGAASLPLLVGVVSRAGNSLRLAMAVPVVGLVLLLLLSFRRSPSDLPAS